MSRATVYRTLQWMVEAGIARKVDFGEGRLRFEHSYRHPRHFHLICKTCNRSFEFLSSDIESLLEEVAAARQLHRASERAADSRHMRIVPDRPGVDDRRRDDRANLRARCAAHCHRHRTERAGVLFPRRGVHARCARPSRVREARGRRAGAPGHAREALPRSAAAGSAARIAADVPVLQRRGERTVFGGHRTAWPTASTIVRH